MIADFHAYEKALGERFLRPLLENHGIELDGKAVLDVGCGYGGVLAALAEAHRLGLRVIVDLVLSQLVLCALARWFFALQERALVLWGVDLSEELRQDH